MTRLFLGLLMLALSTLSAAAQNTGGVFPPSVDEGHKSAQYRSAYNVDNENFNQRLHYQQAINGDFMWRIIGQTRETASSDFDFDFLQAELFWELSPEDTPYRHGVRFDARLRDDNRPHQLGFNWIHQWKFGDGWTGRLVGLSSFQFGDNNADGIFLAPRAHLSRKLDSGVSLGLEYYGNFGSTDNFTVSKTGQTLGPFISTKLTGKTSIMAGVQLGLNDAAPDADLRLWVTQGF